MDVKRVLVPVSGDKSDEEAVKLACSIAKKSKAKVYALHVIEVERVLPLDARIDSDIRKAEQIFEGLERVAEEEEDYQIESELLQAREAGPAIVEEAMKKGADLIIMGFTYKKRFGQFSLGSTLPYVLRNAQCRVLVYREPVILASPTEGTPTQRKYEPVFDGSRRFFTLPDRSR